MDSVGRTRVGKYELGRTLGEGTFAKVKFAKDVETGESVAIKIFDKDKILRHKMVGQIKREISTMKLIRHPNVIRIYEVRHKSELALVIASKTKIYLVLEFVDGGELFDKIARRGKLKEEEARKYFQQLINAVDYCHSRGVFHRDLKPENLLLDTNGVLKISDFGLSALPQQVHVIRDKGYDGAKADIWSCGVILFILMAGYLPFEGSNLMSLYKKIFKADFSCPNWFSTSAKKLIKRILDTNPQTVSCFCEAFLRMIEKSSNSKSKFAYTPDYNAATLQRINISQIIENEWFKKGYQPPQFETTEVSLDDVDAIFNESGEATNIVVERREERPVVMNAFDLISTSQGLDLGILFEKQLGLVKRETRFTSKHPANEILFKIEEACKPMGFDVKKQNYKLKLQGEKSGRKGHLAIATEVKDHVQLFYLGIPHSPRLKVLALKVFEVAPLLHVVEIRKAKGDTLEFHKFFKNLSMGLKDIMWKSQEETSGSDKARRED
ncbi:hypothetical protein ZIOFF_050869 [Zingiber officinale]|uniref:non-specific serine/threonine protein kinase n=1 Tax=Zingiber officinale TaxID=94328 RepID=A0A8J5G1A5_ZINOF|nr:hypothetical protein ZIOFF_050869 [Zingiber officinale]